MYAGTIVEEGKTSDILSHPLHPYTRGLISCIPVIDSRHSPSARLNALDGMVPELYGLQSGCPFADRCPERMADCERVSPHAVDRGEDRRVACLRYGQEGDR